MQFRAGKKTAQDVSLSDTMEIGSDGTPLELMDVLSDDTDLLADITHREELLQLRQSMGCLTAQEQTVLQMRYGLGGGEPLRQREVAERTGLSRSYISRIEKRALEKLRAALD